MGETKSSTVIAEVKALIERPVEDVFAYVSDPRNEPKWHTQILQVRPIDGGASESGPPRAWSQGSRWVVTARFFGRMESEVEVTAFEPNRRIEFTTRTGPVLPVATCLLEPDDGGTVFTRRTEIPVRGVYRLLKPLIQRDTSRRQGMFVKNLKNILEGGGD